MEILLLIPPGLFLIVLAYDFDCMIYNIHPSPSEKLLDWVIKALGL
jgi:hypothetical protein